MTTKRSKRAPGVRLSAKRPCWEIVHPFGQRWHARFVARNGETIAWTETYTRKQAALAAVRAIESAAQGIPLVWTAVPSKTSTVNDSRRIFKFVDAARSTRRKRGAKARKGKK